MPRSRPAHRAHCGNASENGGALGKSKRAIGTYVAELEAQGICHVKIGKNQFAGTILEISDAYWPYHRAADSLESEEQKSYVDSVRESFLALECGSGRFGAPETAAAKDLYRRGIPLAVIQDAMLMGACRKLVYLLNGSSAEPIASLAYFEGLIAEIREHPIPADYREYLRKKCEQLCRAWARTSADLLKKGGCLDMDRRQNVP